MLVRVVLSLMSHVAFSCADFVVLVRRGGLFVCYEREEGFHDDWEMSIRNGMKGYHGTCFMTRGRVGYRGVFFNW